MYAQMLKKIVDTVFGKFGYQIIKKGGAGRLNLYDPHYLSKICTPETVIDVGVGHGTDPLYKAFPSAYFILIEPINEYQSSINEILAKYEGTVYYKAVGQKRGTLELDVDLDNLELSSLFERTKLTETKGHRVEKRKIEMATLDGLLNPPNNLERPLILKIDTEGNELNVLKGAGLLLESTDFVIVEASIAKRFENSYEFDELITFMAEKGFKLFSILSITHLAEEIRPRFADVIFAKCTDYP
jgi:FkbM family methyltransferase